METKVNYVKVGLFVILLSLAGIISVIWLLGKSGKSYKNYVVYMHEAVSGLNIQAPVKFNGVEVGEVSEISLGYPDVQKVRLVLRIESNIPITEATYATLMTQGITGLTYIGLKADTINAAPLKIRKGDAYPVIKSAPSLLVQLDSFLRDLTINFNKLSNHVDRIFNDKNYELLDKNLENITSFTTMLKDNSSHVEKMIQTSQKLSSSALKASEQLNEVTDDLKQVTEEIKQRPSIIISNRERRHGPGE